MRVSMGELPCTGDIGAGAVATSSLEEGADELVVLILSPGAANNGVARKSAPSRVAAAVVARVLVRFDGIIVWLPLKWLARISSRDSIKRGNCNFGADGVSPDAEQNSRGIGYRTARLRHSRCESQAVFTWLRATGGWQAVTLCFRESAGATVSTFEAQKQTHLELRRDCVWLNSAHRNDRPESGTRRRRDPGYQE